MCHHMDFTQGRETESWEDICWRGHFVDLFSNWHNSPRNVVADSWTPNKGRSLPNRYSLVTATLIWQILTLMFICWLMSRALELQNTRVLLILGVSRELVLSSHIPLVHLGNIPDWAFEDEAEIAKPDAHHNMISCNSATATVEDFLRRAYVNSESCGPKLHYQ